MVHIYRYDNQLYLQLDPHHPSYASVYLIVRGLLTSYEVSDYIWSVGYDDLTLLKTKMTSLGFVEGRTIDLEAADLITQIYEWDQVNKAVKEGEYNDKVLALLNGNIKTTLYEDQLAGVGYILNNPRCGLFDSMGSGKSLQALVVMKILRIKKALIVAPKSVLVGFSKEIEKHTDFSYVTIPPGRLKALNFIEEHKDKDWDICLVHAENLVRPRKKGEVDNNKFQSKVLEVLLRMHFDMVVVDEFHKYKNPDAKRTQCILSLCNNSQVASRVLLMTGTPISESPLNAYTFLNLVGDSWLPHIVKFSNHFIINKKIKINREYVVQGRKTQRKVTVEKVVGYKHLRELKNRIERFSIRRTKEDLKGFPPKTFSTRYANLAGKQHALYRAICGELRRELSAMTYINLEQLVSANSRMLRLRQVMNHPNLINEEGESGKYLELDDLLEEVLADPTAKAVVWTEYRAAVDNLYNRYNAEYGAVKIYGGISDKAWADAVHNFENEPSPRVAIGIPAKAGEGTDFLARARTAIYLDRPYSYTLYTQSLDRIHRRVKTSGNLSKLDVLRSKPATIVFLDVENSVDGLVKMMLERKGEVADALSTEDRKLIKMGKAEVLRYLK